MDRHPSTGWPRQGAHAIATDPSNRFAFVPHIARIQDNVLEPPKNNPGPNVILQFRFDAQTGRLTPNTPFGLSRRTGSVRATIAFIPIWTSSIFPTSRAAASPPIGSTRNRHALRSADGLDAARRYSPQHLFADSPDASGQFLYVGNRGHNSIAGFAVDPHRAFDGRRACGDRSGSERVLSRPGGPFPFAAGTASGRLASYRIKPRPAR